MASWRGSIGSPNAAREVGRALARNPVPIVVPCHRILAKGRRIGGFSAPGGTLTKERLLALEGAHVAAETPLLPGLLDSTDDRPSCSPASARFRARRSIRPGRWSWRWRGCATRRWRNMRRVAHVFPTSYAAVDRELPALLARERPDVLLMFGLAAHRRHISIETRARNAISRAVPDASGQLPAASLIVAGRARRAAVAGAGAAAPGRGTRDRDAGSAVGRCRQLSLQLSVLARRRGGGAGPAARA